MSHSKLTKRGHSLYLEKWNPAAKKYINICKLCGRRGYRPTIETAAPSARQRLIFAELAKTLPRMELDQWGRCRDCAAIQDKQLGRAPVRRQED